MRRFPLCGGFLFVARLAKNLAFGELGITFSKSPRPNAVMHFRGRIYVIDLEIAPRTAKHTWPIPFEP